MTFNKHFVAVIKANSKILREDRSSEHPTVYIPFGSEYSILLKNLFSRKACVSVSIDGEDILNGNSLIIDANSEINLERFLKDDLSKGNKLKFIEKTEQISDYRGDKVDDGIVRISYQFEQYVQPVNWNLNRRLNVLEDYWFPTNKYYGNSVVGGDINCCANNTDGAVFACASSSFNDNGITVPGSQSNQQFTQGSIGTLESEVHVITLILRGKTANHVVKEPMVITKCKCPTCGKLNNGHKFCLNCGTALQVF